MLIRHTVPYLWSRSSQIPSSIGTPALKLSPPRLCGPVLLPRVGRHFGDGVFQRSLLAHWRQVLAHQV